MNKQQRVETLRQVVMHAIKGEQDLAESLFKSVVAAHGRRIVVGESNYSVDGDPEFDARREFQRELEDDLEAGDIDGELGDAEGELDGVDSEAGDGDEIIDAIVAKLEDGAVDDETLAQILDLLVDEEGGEEGGEGLEDEVAPDAETGELSVDDLASALGAEGDPAAEELPPQM